MRKDKDDDEDRIRMNVSKEDEGGDKKDLAVALEDLQLRGDVSVEIAGAVNGLLG